MKTIEQIEKIPSDGIIVRPEGGVVRIFFDVKPAQPIVIEGEEEGNAPEDLCECYNVDVPQPATYGAIVSAIVTDRYSPDDVQALISNYTEAQGDSGLSDEKATEYREEWQEFQAWRIKAKSVAAAVVGKLI